MLGKKKRIGYNDIYLKLIFYLLKKNRLGDRQSASAIIDKYNGHSISGSSAPLQVRFADSPAQKRLKNQTSGSKRTTTVKNPRDLFPCGFPVRSMMPITPETMLGIAPSSSSTHNG